MSNCLQTKWLWVRISLLSNDNISCNEAKTVGNLIQVQLDCKLVYNFSIKRKDPESIFTYLQPAIVLEKETVHMNPVILFNRLSMLMNREEERVNLFKSELTPESASLFKDGKMNRANKAELRNRIFQFNMRSDTTTSDVYIVDGGALLNQPNWNPQGDIINYMSNSNNMLHQDIATVVQTCLSDLMVMMTFNKIRRTFKS